LEEETGVESAIVKKGVALVELEDSMKKESKYRVQLLDLYSLRVVEEK
jgi:hypothetical protein